MKFFLSTLITDHLSTLITAVHASSYVPGKDSSLFGPFSLEPSWPRILADVRNSSPYKVVHHG